MQNISTNTLCVGYLLRIYISMNIPQYSFIAQMYGSEHSARRRGRFIAPVFQPNQMVLMCRNDANCNAILWNFVGTGTINRSPTAADGLPFCGCLRICKYHKIVHQRTLATCYDTTTYTKCLLSHCKNHTFAM